MSYICCVSQDRPPRARRGPCTCPSIPALETLLPAAVRGSPCSPGAPSQGWDAAGCTHRPGQVLAE